MSTVIQQIRGLRRERGMSQSVLAETSGVSLATVKRTESGKHAPTLPHLEQMARALGCTLRLVGTHSGVADYDLSTGVTPGKVQNGSTSGRPDGQVPKNETGPEDARQRHPSGPDHEELTSVDQEAAPAAGPHPAGLAAA